MQGEKGTGPEEELLQKQEESLVASRTLKRGADQLEDEA